MSIVDALTGLSVIVVIIVFLLVLDYLRTRRESIVIETLQSEKADLSKTNFDLLERVQKTQQSQADQLNCMSRTIVEVSEKMTNLQVNLHNIIDEKLRIQSIEFKKDLNRVNNKLDTILGFVMECDNDSCPTKKRISNYLKSHQYTDNVP